MVGGWALLFFAMLVSLVVVGQHRAEGAPTTSFSIAVLSDTHIGDGGTSPYNGESCNSTVFLTQAINEINSLIEKYDIRWVFITGDITNSAEPTQFQKARELLDLLEVPYFPLMGNHDVWPYNSQMETLQPVGDQLFAEYFNQSFLPDYLQNINTSLCNVGAQVDDDEACSTSLSIELDYYGLEKSWNPQMLLYSQFQNYAMTVTISGEDAEDGSGSSSSNNNKTLVFLCMDWNTRAPAILMDKNKGALPEGDLQDFPGGTLPWLKAQVQALGEKFQGREEDLQVITLQHQPYMTPWFIPRWSFTFDDEQERQIQEALASGLPIDTYWGVIAGHMHRWWNSTAFELPLEWRHFWQWETNACKGQWDNATIHSGFSILRFEDLRLVDLIAIQPPASRS